MSECLPPTLRILIERIVGGKNQIKMVRIIGMSHSVFLEIVTPNLKRYRPYPRSCFGSYQRGLDFNLMHPLPIHSCLAIYGVLPYNGNKFFRFRKPENVFGDRRIEGLVYPNNKWVSDLAETYKE